MACVICGRPLEGPSPVAGSLSLRPPVLVFDPRPRLVDADRGTLAPTLQPAHPACAPYRAPVPRA